MKFVVDTNIVFSAILNANSMIASILIKLQTNQIFYTTNQLLVEIEKHRTKLKKITLFSNSELSELISMITRQIIFIDIKTIPIYVFQQANALTTDVDIDDTEFVALTEYLNAKLWTGDKILIKGLEQKGWQKFITTSELANLLLDTI